MVGLGDLPGGAFFSEAYGVSGDGSKIVGWSETGASTTNEAFLWDDIHGMRNLKSVLLNDFHLDSDLAGWTLIKATAISQDGTTIVGYGLNPSGQMEAWRAVVPEPSTVSLAVVALVLLRLIHTWLICDKIARSPAH
jgi:probable HAF family extracellular repeat protein